MFLPPPSLPVLRLHARGRPGPLHRLLGCIDRPGHAAVSVGGSGSYFVDCVNVFLCHAHLPSIPPHTHPPSLPHPSGCPPTPTSHICGMQPSCDSPHETHPHTFDLFRVSTPTSYICAMLPSCHPPPHFPTLSISSGCPPPRPTSVPWTFSRAATPCLPAGGGRMRCGGGGWRGWREGQRGG